MCFERSSGGHDGYSFIPRWNEEAAHDQHEPLPTSDFADDTLLISGSLKHTTTMLDDLTKATTAHGLQLHARKTLAQAILTQAIFTRTFCVS